MNKFFFSTLILLAGCVLTNILAVNAAAQGQLNCTSNCQQFAGNQACYDICLTMCNLPGSPWMVPPCQVLGNDEYNGCYHVVKPLPLGINQRVCEFCYLFSYNPGTGQVDVISGPAKIACWTEPIKKVGVCCCRRIPRRCRCCLFRRLRR